MSEIISLLSDRVLLKELKKESTKGGIILPEASDKSLKWEVVSIGKEVEAVKVGDIVALAQWSGEAIKLNDTDYRLANEGEILGIFT